LNETNPEGTLCRAIGLISSIGECRGGGAILEEKRLKRHNQMQRKYKCDS
jgi:hypothetical protein